MIKENHFLQSVQLYRTDSKDNHNQKNFGKVIKYLKKIKKKKNRIKIKIKQQMILSVKKVINTKNY